MKISSELASQHFFKYLIAELLYELGRTEWESKYNEHDLTIEPWAVGVWVKEAGTIISYNDLAKFLESIALAKAEHLAVQRRSKCLFLVQGSQRPWYAVQLLHGHLKCDCSLWQQRHKRLKKECPPLLKAMGTIYCHHTKAVELKL